MELWPQREVSITLICPISIDTNMRKNSIDETGFEPVSSNVALDYKGPYEKMIPLDEAVDVIMLAADTRIGKFFYHSWAYLGAYLRPLFPDYVDKRMLMVSRL